MTGSPDVTAAQLQRPLRLNKQTLRPACAGAAENLIGALRGYACRHACVPAFNLEIVACDVERPGNIGLSIALPKLPSPLLPLM